MASDPWQALGVSTVINAAGKLTALGGTAQSERVAAAQSEAARTHVDVAELRAAAGARIAGMTGAEAACVTPGAAAGLAISVAAAIVGADIERVQRLPDSSGLPNGVLLQAGHAIDFGAPVTQMIALGGGVPRIVGAVNRVTEAQLRGALVRGEALAAFVFVQSHHCAQQGMLSLARCIALCREAALPVIVDAAAEQDLSRYVSQGADLVIYSGGKAVGGPTSGFIAGREELIEACELQQHGIARAMKVGKEQTAGLLIALDEYEDARGQTSERCARVNRLWLDVLGKFDVVDARLEPDEAGRAIERVSVRARDDTFDPRALVRFLRDGRPSIRTRNHHLDAGLVLFDPREVSLEEAELVAARLREFFVSQ